MNEWILVSPMLTVLVGACAALVSQAIHPQRKGDVAIKIAAFSLLMAGVQIAILGFRAYGLSSSGLFRVDGMSLGLSLVITFFLLLGVGCLFQEKNGTWSYTAPAALILATTAYAGIFANDGLLLFLSLSTMLVFIRWSYAIWALQVDLKNESSGVLGILGWFVFAGFCMTVLIQAAGSGRYDKIELAAVTGANVAPFHIGLLGLLFVHAIGFLPTPVDPYFDQSPRLGHWGGVAFSRTVVPAVFMLMAIRWMWLFGFNIQLLPITQIDLGLVIGALLIFLSGMGVWVLLTDQTALRVIAHYSILSMSFGLLPFFLAEPELLKVGLAHFCLGGAVTFIVWAAFAEMELGTLCLFSRLKEAVHGATLRVQMMVAFGLIGLAFPFGAPGNLLMKSLWSKASEGVSATSILSAILLILLAANVLLMSIRIVQTFQMDAERNSKWEGGAVVQKIWSYTLMTIVLILGVHPAPLYNYFAHSIRLLLKAN